MQAREEQVRAFAGMEPVGRREGREPRDYYRTPAEAVVPFLARWSRRVQAPARILEPAAGDGALLPALRRTWPEATIDAQDIAPQHDAVRRVDFLLPVTRASYDLVITNPPFVHAEAFIQNGRALVRPGGHLALLLRLGFLGSQQRRGLWRAAMPSDVYVLSERPSFKGG
ncbi:MAG TPA: hypothetical protein VFE37_26135, partial [Chloroflexota bacterium]|nr:hypothetical protein [Chloroflexota bacterium]